MKPTDLRVGNFISFLGVPTRVGELIVKQFQDCYVSVFGNESVDKYVQEKGITPIELSKNWLIAFGFEQMPDFERGFKFTDKKRYKTFEAKIHSDGVSIFNLSECDRTQWQFITIIKYVHQLQNLYFAIALEDLQLKVDEANID